MSQRTVAAVAWPVLVFSLEMSDEPAQASLTEQLSRWIGGTSVTHRDVVGQVYPTLHRLAALALARETGPHTLQTTALVHEAYLELGRRDGAWRDRRHFFASAALCMRHILVDHARHKQAAKRGGAMNIATLDERIDVEAPSEHDLIELDQALQVLAGINERRAQTLVLAYFGGLERGEIAQTLEVSLRTVDRELRLGEAWLAQALA
jgi:RNA polymerase sigma factor (TIGR02999 family)